MSSISHQKMATQRSIRSNGNPTKKSRLSFRSAMEWWSTSEDMTSLHSFSVKKDIMSWEMTISDTGNPYRQSPSTDFSMKNMEMCACSEIFIRSGSAQQESIPACPTFMLGHSMGSSLLRQYIQMYGNGLAGVVLMGTVAGS